MGVFSAHVLDSNIDEKFFNKPISVIGKIDSLVGQSGQKSRFTLQVSEPFQGKLKLSWYGKKSKLLQSGDTWKLRIKIKAI